MSLGFSIVDNGEGIFSPGGRYLAVLVTFSGDNSYPAGGYPLDPKMLKLNKIIQVIPAGDELGFNFDFDPVNSKLIWYWIKASGLSGTVDPASAGTPTGSNGTTSAGTPTGSNSSDSAGTPAGANSLDSAGTPSGTNSSDSAGTPSGSLTTPLFSFGNRNWNTQSYFDIFGGTRNDNRNADGVEVTNAEFIAPYTTVAAGTWTVGALSDPDVPRSIMISIKNDSGGPLNLFEGTMTFTVTGTDIDTGLTRTLNIPLVSTALNKTIANGSFRSAQMNPLGSTVCFRTITNVTLDNVPDNGLKISVGIGTIIELVKSLPTMALNDVLNVALNGTKETLAGNLIAPGPPTVQHSFRFSDIADGDDISVTYPQRSGYTGSITTPIFTGDPMAGHTHTFTGDPLSTHSHVFTGDPMTPHSHTFSGDPLPVHGHSFTGDPMADHTHGLTLTGAVGPLQEVDAGTDLSAATDVKVLIIGQ